MKPLSGSLTSARACTHASSSSAAAAAAASRHEAARKSSTQPVLAQLYSSSRASVLRFQRTFLGSAPERARTTHTRIAHHKDTWSSTTPTPTCLYTQPPHFHPSFLMYRACPAQDEHAAPAQDEHAAPPGSRLVFNMGSLLLVGTGT